MEESGEFQLRSGIQQALEVLFQDVSFIEKDAHKLPQFLNTDSLRLINPDFPDIEDWQLKSRIFENKTYQRSSNLSRFIMKAAALVTERKTKQISPKFSPDFVTRFRSVRGTPAHANPWTWLEVSETSYDGYISIQDDRLFNFHADQPLIEIASGHLDSDGRTMHTSIKYLYVPHRNFVQSEPSQSEVDSAPFYNKQLSENENLLAIIEAGQQISH